MSLRKISTAAVAATLATTAAALLLAGCSSSPSSATTTPPTPAATTSAAPGAPATGWQSPAGTWDLAPDMSAAAAKAGLEMLGQEMLQVHYHAHLDVIVDGKQIVVPPSIGIDQVRNKISPLHTHTPDGILHIESAADTPFTLGQAFTEWGEALSPTQVGPKAVGTDEALHVFVNGKEVTTDPTRIVLHSHDEIAVWVGPKSTTPQVPASFPWTTNYPQ